MSIFPEDNKYAGNTDYFKAKIEGQPYRIRIIGPGVVGWENWSEDGRPSRGFLADKPRVGPYPLKPVREFTALLVWNYDLEKIQIWHVTQAKVKKSLEKMEGMKGDATTYDMLITRFGDGKDTAYTLKALPVSHVPNEALECLELEPVNLYALYVGKDPFVDMHAGREGLDESAIA
jgi:hypothetical protein